MSARPAPTGLASAAPPPVVPGPPAIDPDDEQFDLATRIGSVEQRLVAREQRIAGQVRQLGRRVGQVAAPGALLLKLGGIALAGAGLAWALRRSDRPAPPHPADAPPASHAAAVPAWVMHLLPLAWPLLPMRWRARVSPATAATVLGVAVPLAQRLLRRTPEVDADAPPTVAQIDLQRFAGTWHEQARLPAPFEGACDGRPSATYTPIDTPTNTPQPRRAGDLRVHNACRASDGALRTADGVARVVPGSGGARLQVSFMPPWLRWLPFVWADLWLLHIDDSAPDYRVAILGHPSRRGLWLLSRRARLPAAELQPLIARAEALGYDTRRLVLAGEPPLPH